MNPSTAATAPEGFIPTHGVVSHGSLDTRGTKPRFARGAVGPPHYLQEAMTLHFGGTMRNTGRLLLAGLISVPIGVALAFFGVVAGLSLIQELLATFLDLRQASWTSFLNPAVLLGIQSPGGTGGIFDAMLGGPGATGGTVSRFITFLITGMLAVGAFSLLKVTWAWARQGGNA